MKLSDKIIKLRKANGWSQEDLAEKLNVSRQAISRWENGTALPDAQNVLQISKLFHVTTDYLLNDDYESDSDIPAVQTAKQETEHLFSRKKRLHLIAAICFTVSWFCPWNKQDRKGPPHNIFHRSLCRDGVSHLPYVLGRYAKGYGNNNPERKTRFPLRKRRA